MDKRGALRLKPGDQILLKHNLGGGVVREVRGTPSCGSDGSDGRFPMIIYEDGGLRMECTYRVIDIVTKCLRSM